MKRYRVQVAVTVEVEEGEELLHNVVHQMGVILDEGDEAVEVRIASVEEV